MPFGPIERIGRLGEGRREEGLVMTERNDQDPRLARIDDALRRIAAESSTPPAWHDGWSRLNLQSSSAEWLAVFQAVRTAGSVPQDAGFYLVSWQIDAITWDEADEALRGIEERLDAIQREHGLGDDDYWPLGEGPPEFEEMSRRYEVAWDALYVARLEDAGEFEMARLFRTDREEFSRRSESGREFFHGPLTDSKSDADPSEWLNHLLTAVSGCVEADSPMGPLGLRSEEEDGVWDVNIYPTPVELVGGAYDGAVVEPGFSLDLEQLRGLFDEVTAFGWDALGLHDPEGPHIYVEGTYRGRDVVLQVLARPPEDAEPGMKFDTTRGPREPE
jgi:hypothetical protein